MKAYYEKYREEFNSPQVLKSIPNGYPAHFHSNVEIFILLDGEYDIKINGIPYTLSSGEIALMSSYDVHEYIKSLSKTTVDMVITFPFSFCKDFISRHKTESPTSPIIKDKTLATTLFSLASEYLNNDNYSMDVKNATSSLFFTLLEEKCTFIKGENKGETILIKNALSYIHKNYNNKIKVSDISKDIGYSSEHLSRVFKKYLGVNIPEYINNLRLLYVENELKKNPDKTITTLLFEAGFSSLASYYRNKKRT